MKEDLIKMVPQPFPYPRQIVLITGALEILGAIGLLIPFTRTVAGICLAVLFVALLSANINARSQRSRCETDQQRLSGYASRCRCSSSLWPCGSLWDKGRSIELAAPPSNAQTTNEQSFL